MERPRLSKDARRSLEERLRVLDEERIPSLERDLEASGDPSIAATLRKCTEEADLVRHTLSVAIPLEELPHDPTIVELGDTVTVRGADSSAPDRFTLVGELEARLEDSWISVDSPLGSALLGARVGDSVEIFSPGGRLRYEVLGIERET